MKKVLSYSLLIFLMACSSDSDSEPAPSCIDKSKITSGPCTANFDPVCGCDGKTYGNACEAGRAGIVAFTAGPCRP